MTLMHLCLVVMTADVNYLSNKILLKQRLKSLHKTVEASVWIYNPKQHFQTEFGMLVNRIMGHWHHVAHGVCSDNQERLC